MGRVPLTLVIGPANAEKAGRVLGGYRAALAAGEEPLLVVPTLADVDHYRRELAASGAVFGVEVMRFAWLVREIARRAGVGGRPLGRLARERVIATAVARAGLTPPSPLAAVAGAPGLARELLGLVDDLEEVRAGPARATQALRAWGEAEPERATYAADLAALVSAYHRELERLGATDERTYAAAALDALRLDPAAWRATPVFVYGFDDLSPLQRDALEALAGRAGADVTVSLTYEPGREAFAARATGFEELRAVADAVEELPARSDFYAAPSRAALHHLERSLFEPEAEAAQPVVAGDAVALLEAGGERAEVELVGAHVARLLRDGVAPDDVAVVFRSLRSVAPLVAQVFDAYGIPAAIDRRVPAGHTALGRGLLGLLRAALEDGGAEDVVAYLRTPGVVDQQGRVDALEGEIRGQGLRTAEQARAAWEADHWALGALERVRAAVGAGPVALCERLAREAAVLLERPHARRAAVLDAHEALDARTAGELRRALGELGRLARIDPALVPAPADLVRVLGDLEVRVGPAPGPGLVAVTEPRAIRARRVRVLFACGLQEGAWPRPARPRPLLGDADRRALARASGLVLPIPADALAAERLLFYQAASRPEERLVLSWRLGDDDGDPIAPSAFVADVTTLFAPALVEATERRHLGAVGWPEGLAPTPRERRRAAAAAAEPVTPPGPGPLRAEPVLELLRGWERFSASGLEAWASCPVRWLVERFVRAQDLRPDPEPMVRGSVAHAVLKDVLEALGPRPLRPGALPAARAALQESLERRGAEVRISVNPERLRAELRRLEADLLRYLDHATQAASAFAPTHLEHEFDVEVADGLRLSGTIDRVDVAAAQAIVYDYKGSRGYPWPTWAKDRRLQMGLYVLAARALFGVEPVGGLYQPLGGRETAARGALVAGADPEMERTLKRGDVVGADAFEAALAEVLELALAAAAELRAGALEARPATCAYGGGCAYPSICRREAAA